MKSIWKFEIPEKAQFILMMPEGTEIIAFQTQGKSAYIWGIVEPTAELKARSFVVRGTGYEIIGDPGTYIGTIQMFNGSLVWHLFEVSQ